MRISKITLGLVLVSVSRVSLHAQTVSPDFQALVHVYPQFVDGIAGGTKSYVSTLQVSATDFLAITRCTFGLLAMPSRRLADVRGVVETGTVFNFALGPSGWQILQSTGDQPLASGSAVLQCDRLVTAHLIYSMKSGGTTVSEATVSAAPPGTMLQIVADQRRGARLGFAITNPFSVPAVYRVSIADLDGRLISSNFFQLQAGGSFARFVDEIAALPREYLGLIVLESFSGMDLYASALRFTGDSFTAIPAMVRVP
jgi:hypothetical protein